MVVCSEKVSIIIPVYNTQASMLDACVKSALGQTYNLIEVLIIDDNPENPIKTNRFSWFDDSRIRLISNKRNLGAAEARNVGVQHATAPYIAFLDADDEWHRLKLEIQLAHIKNNRLGAVCTGYVAVDQNERVLFSARPFSRLNNLKLWSTTNVCCSSVLIDSG